MSEHLQNTVFDLLHGVGHSVRPVHLHLAGRLVHRKLVPLQVELFVGQGQVLNDGILAACDVVVVARVKPAAHIQSGDVLAGLVRRIQIRAGAVAVEVRYIRRRLSRIVEVRNAVPQPVALPHRDVIHLDGEEGIQAGLPRPAVNVFSDGEQVGPLAGVFDHIQAGILDR